MRGTSHRFRRAPRLRDRHGRGERFAFEPFIGRACPDCGSATVVSPCSRCDGWLVACDCDDVSRAFDRYVRADGRCPSCRCGEG